MSLPYALLIHGFTGSGPGHWQNWLAGRLAEAGALVDLPHLSDPDRPDIDVWLAELRNHLRAAPTDGERVLLAHSCGATLWLHHAARLTDDSADQMLRFDRVLLVAPPGPRWHSPDVHGFAPTSLDAAGIRRAARRTRLVAGGDDDACSVAEAVEMAEALKIDLDVVSNGAHLNTAAGYGPWPAVLDWVTDRHTRIVGNAPTVD